MLTTLQILRLDSGRYDDVLDVAEYLGKHDHGSASNAVAIMVRQSELFKTTFEKLRASGAEGAGASR